MQIVLNEFHEVIVGSKYYNFTHPSITIQVDNPSFSDITKLRFEGISSNVVGKILLDIEARPLPVLSGDHELLSSILLKEQQVNGVLVKLNAYVFSSNVANYYGPAHYQYQCCNYKFLINWGDGTNSIIFTNNLTNQPFENCFNIRPEHIYNKSSIAAGSCQTYSINVRAIKMGTCTNNQMVVQDGEIFDAPNLTAVVCNAECKAVTRRIENSTIFNYSNSTYKIRGEIQQNSNPSFSWTSPKFWSRITFYKKKSNGKYKKAKPPVNMTANAKGKWYLTTCTDPTSFDESRTESHRREFKVKVSGLPGGFTSSLLDNPPVRGNYSVVVNNSGSQPITYVLSNVSLW